MNTPEVIGRWPDGADPRAGTKFGYLSQTLEGNGFGGIRAVLFDSVDDEDRGGFVIRLTQTDPSAGFLPHAKLIEDGIEIHVAGDHEGLETLRQLAEVIDHVRIRMAALGLSL